ncbi:hypothetical protein P7C70_g4387, partial [Phenoliferia sp. Uapishka_3]
MANSDRDTVREAATAPPPVAAATAQLEGEDVLELTRFAEKKDWIDAKIKFLKSLPPVDAISPDPPAPSPTTKEELKAWWSEHDRIELEIGQYDMGDLAKLKTLAKNTTQHDLSPADTDLIEITLTTLFAVDKLLHLLRNRRKALTLLNYRLRWEATVATASAEHQQIISNLPRFLQKSRWTTPPSQLSSSRLSLDLSSPPRSQTPPSSTIRLSSSSSSISSNSSFTNSAMSRTMRSEVLSLELAGQKSKIHSLVSASIPATAQRLDKLIDASPTPLPDAFLDFQDKLEEDTRNLTDGLGTFLADMVKQWRNADEVFWIAWGVEHKAELLGREVDEALLKLPTRESADGFEKGVEGARVELREAQKSLGDRRRTEGFLPMPTHHVMPEQDEENRDLLETMEENVKKAARVLAGAEVKVKGYRFAAEALERSVVLRADMDAVLRSLNAFIDSATGFVGKPDLEDIRCLDLIPEESEVDEDWRHLAGDIVPVLNSIPQLLQRAATVIVDLNKAGIDPNVRHILKEATAGLANAKSKVEGLISEQDTARQRLEAAREWNAAVGLCGKKVEEVRVGVVEELEESRWKEGRILGTTPLDVAKLLADLSRKVDLVLETPLAKAPNLLSEPHPYLHSHLQSRTSSLRSDFDHLLDLHSLLPNLRAQQEATTTLLNDLITIEVELSHISKEAEIALTKTSGLWHEDGLWKTLANLQSRLVKATARHEDRHSTAHLRIPFVSPEESSKKAVNGTRRAELPSVLADVPCTPSQKPSPPLSFSIEEQDQQVRNAVNSALGITSARIDETRHRLAVLEHQGQAFGWDDMLGTVTMTLAAIERTVQANQSAFDAREGNNEDFLSNLLSKARKTASDLEVSGISLASSSSSFQTLLSSPVASSPPFNSHPDRLNFLDSTNERHKAAVDANQALLAWLLAAEEERKRKAAVDVAILVEAKEVEDALGEARDRLEEFVKAERALLGRPDLSDERCLLRSEAEGEFDSRLEALSEGLSAAVASVPVLLDRASATLVNLKREDLDESVSKRIREASENLERAQALAKDAQDTTLRNRSTLAVARALDSALLEAEDVLLACKAKINSWIETARWTGEKKVDPAGATILEVDSETEDPRQRIPAILPSLLTGAEPLRIDYPTLHLYLERRAEHLNSSFAGLAFLRALFVDVQAQRDEAVSGLSQIALLAQGVEKTSDEAQTSIAALDNHAQVEIQRAKLEDLRKRHLALDSQHRQLSASISGSVRQVTYPPKLPESEPASSLPILPNVASPTPTARPAPFDVPLQNSEVGHAINDALKDARSGIEEIGAKLDALHHVCESFDWDHSHDDAHRLLAALADRVEKNQSTFRAGPQDTEDSLEASFRAASSTSSDLSQHRHSQRSLSTALDTLKTTQPQVFFAPEFHSFRSTQMAQLDERLAAAVATSLATTAVITSRQKDLSDRREREKFAEAFRQEALGRRLALWLGSRRSLETRLRDVSEATAKLIEDATKETRRLESWNLIVRDERAKLLSSEELTSTSDHGDDPLQHAKTTCILLAEQLQTLDTLSVDLSTVESALSEELASLDSSEDLVFITQASASLRVELDSARACVQLLKAALAQAESDAIDWLGLRQAELEARKQRHEAEVRERRRLEEALLAKWCESGSTLNERIQLAQVTLDDFAAHIEPMIALISPTPKGNGSPPPNRRPDSNDHGKTPTEVLEASPLSLQRDTSLSQVGSELESIKTAIIQLQNEAAATEGHVYEPTTPLVVLDGKLLELRRRSSFIRSALEQAIVDRNAAAVVASAEQLSPEDLRRTPGKSRPIPTFTSPADVEDVFGPTLYSAPFGEEEQDVYDDVEGSPTGELQHQLNKVPTQRWLDPQLTFQLPTAEDAEEVQLQLSVLSAHLEELATNSTGSDLDFRYQPLRSALESKWLESERMAALSDFRDRIAGADTALSDLLTSIDAATPGLDMPPASRPSTPSGSPSLSLPLNEALLDATRAVTKARKEAVPLIDDPRVETHIARIEQAFSEMTAMVEDLHFSTARPASSASSVQSSRSSRHFQHSRPPSRQQAPSRETSFTGSSRLSSSSRLSTASSKAPSSSRPPVSSRLPSPRLDFGMATPRKPKASQIPTPTPRSRVSSMAATVPKAFAFGLARRPLSKSTSGVEGRRASLGASLIGDSPILSNRLRTSTSSRRESSSSSRRDSLASSTSSTSRRSSMFTSPTPTRGPRSITGSEGRRRLSYPHYPSPSWAKSHYKANPKRNVDVEVGRIVNDFPGNVPIKAAENETKIDSGMYWIGERLYFCRILRSKTAMVRVGGGWRELSAFLLSHFADSAEVAANVQVSPTASRGSLEPTWISSNSSRASLSKSTSSLALSPLVSPASTLSLSVRSHSGSNNRSPLHKTPQPQLGFNGSSPGRLTPRASKVWHL